MLSSKWDRLKRILTTAQRMGTVTSYQPYWSAYVTALPARLVVVYDSAAGDQKPALDTKIRSFGYQAQPHPHTDAVTYTRGDPDPFDRTFDDIVEKLGPPRLQ